MKHKAPVPGLAQALRELGLVHSNGVLRRLETYEALLRDRGTTLGFIAKSDRSRIRLRHILDSLRAAVVVRSSDETAFDIGSGAGLPGLVVAIVRPGLSVQLIEARRPRVAFLELAIERVGVPNASVVPRRIEDVDGTVDVCFARAFAPLERSWEAALPHLRRGGRLVYFAGARTELPGGTEAPRSHDAPEVPDLHDAPQVSDLLKLPEGATDIAIWERPAPGPEEVREPASLPGHAVLESLGPLIIMTR